MDYSRDSNAFDFCFLKLVGILNFIKFFRKFFCIQINWNSNAIKYCGN